MKRARSQRGSRKWHIQGVCIWQTRYQILDRRVSLSSTITVSIASTPFKRNRFGSIVHLSTRIKQYNCIAGSKALTRERELVSQPKFFFSSCLSQPNARTSHPKLLGRKIGAEIRALFI